VALFQKRCQEKEGRKVKKLVGKVKIILLLVATLIPIFQLRAASATTYTFKPPGIYASGSLAVCGSSSYSAARLANEADTIAVAEYIMVGQKYSLAGGIDEYYCISRGVLIFDTSSIPDDFQIASAVIRLTVYSKDEVKTSFDIVVQKGDGVHPHYPIEASDYYLAYYSGDGGRYPAEMAPTSGEVIIQLNSEGISWINKTGLTKFCLRSSKDIAGISPTTEEMIRFRGVSLEISSPPPLTISLSPTFVVMDVGSSQTFVCTASGGSPPYSYTWFVNGKNTGVTTAEFTFTAPWEEMGNNVTIRCYVSDTRGVYQSAQAIAKIKIPKGLLNQTGLIRKEYIGIRVQLWHVDTNYPYKERYAVYITIDNLWHIEKGNDAFYPVEMKLTVKLPDVCEEVYHEPHAGDYGSSPVSFSVGVSIEGIGVGFAITPPRYYVDYHREVKEGKLTATWTAKTYKKIFGIYWGWGILFYDQTRFFLEFDTPKDYKPAVAVNLITSIYFDYVDGYMLVSNEDTGWIELDPPGTSIDPGELPSLTSPETIYLPPKITREIKTYTIEPFYWYGHEGMLVTIITKAKYSFYNRNGELIREEVGGAVWRGLLL
jgi:hypothetical protein